MKRAPVAQRVPNSIGGGVDHGFLGDCRHIISCVGVVSLVAVGWVIRGGSRTRGTNDQRSARKRRHPDEERATVRGLGTQSRSGDHERRERQRVHGHHELKLASPASWPSPHTTSAAHSPDHRAHRLQTPHPAARLCRFGSPRYGDEDLARLAAVLGFTDQSHLTHTIRSENGTTPAALRRALAIHTAA